jgi:uncharacterized tellurite resistance protein B-like protein
MASLTLTVGALTSTVTSGDAMATELLDLYAQALGVPANLTNQQRLNFVRDALVAHIRNTARQRRIYNEERPAQIAGQAAAALLDWS